MLYYDHLSHNSLTAIINSFDQVSVIIYFDPKDEKEDTLEFSKKIYNRLKDLNIGEIQSIYKEPAIFAFNNDFDPQEKYLPVLKIITNDHRILITTRYGASVFKPLTKTKAISEEITTWVNNVAKSMQLILDKLVDETPIVDDTHFHLHVFKSGNGILKDALLKLGVSLSFEYPEKLNGINILGVPIEYEKIYGSFDLVDLDFNKEEVKFEIDMFAAVEFKKGEKIDLITTLNILEDRYISYMRDLNE